MHHILDLSTTIASEWVLALLKIVFILTTPFPKSSVIQLQIAPSNYFLYTKLKNTAMLLTNLFVTVCKAVRKQKKIDFHMKLGLCDPLQSDLQVFFTL